MGCAASVQIINKTEQSKQDTMSQSQSSDKNSEMDENLYSRQMYVLGVDAMKRMQQSNVLIVGLGGLGVEIAKNVILTGVKSVTIHDDKQVSFADLSSQFYLSEKDVGKNRAEVSVTQLKELNSYVPVKTLSGELTDDILTSHNVVVFTDHHIASLAEKNEVCRRNGVKFIAAESRGVFGSLFCDFGVGFEVYDADGETPIQNIVTNITNDNPAVVSVHDEKAIHGYYDGDYVTFDSIEGMTEINQAGPLKVKSTGKHTFTVDIDATKFGTYHGSGYVKQSKQVQKIDYLPLSESIKNPTIIDTDFAKFGRPQLLHAAFQALNDFQKSNNNQLPASYDRKDADRLVELTKSYAEEVDERVVRYLSYTARGNLSPMAAFVGGVAAQEVQKATSGKFTPLNQWMHFDSLESLPSDESQLPSPQDAQPQGTRYDGQIAVFGSAYQQLLMNQKVFIVGAGALGCEYIKSFAMMGIGCGPQGKVFITDMDNIEISNLNRQFLFRKKHVGKLKSTVAAEVAKEMNHSLNVIALQDKVAPQTEDVFDDDFWENLNLITNALDNVQARLYVDQRCVYYRKPLLEAGTLGTKGNTQVVIPFLTESYGSTRDPPEKEIPICTLKNFPNAIEHTIQWSRDLFEGMFNKAPSDVNTYLTKADFVQEMDQQKRTILEGIYENLVSSKPVNFEECVVWARLKFEQLYNNQILQLLYNFPLDMTTSSGTKFWGGPKRAPTALTFDGNDQAHLDFVISAAHLRANLYNIQAPTADYDYKKVLNNITVPEFTPKSGVKIETEEKKKEGDSAPADNDDDDQVVNELLASIPKPSELSNWRLNVIEFEKDDDTNHHIDFVTAASNMRARNYKIPEANKHTTKGIAGKIIPAMVTTTALVTGLASFEIYKLLYKFDNVELYKNAFVNIALPFVTFGEPGVPAKSKYLDKEWSLWDRFEINKGKDITLKELKESFEKEHNLEISMMSAGTAVIYSFFGNKKKIAERMAMPVSEAVKDVTKTEYLPKQKYISFEICCNDQEGEDADVPYLRYQFKNF
ncbi:ubiquitin-activating enzyme E1 [Acrasis kona]|uniref:E1 ubiquitin-activating enzyme n=1 Tax=Acrasis kona TaxID=1008807 RepID=A0AAW2YYD0_9EUKA